MSSSTGQAAQDPERRVIRIGGAEAADREGTGSSGTVTVNGAVTTATARGRFLCLADDLAPGNYAIVRTA